ncbi:hypothetical protein D5E86_24490 [Vibrio parahaemolyticus]|nr:hypothetical protein D5E86_24490 [Vibrio parahaemolyticus]
MATIVICASIPKNINWLNKHNKAFKSDLQRSAFSLRSSIAERSSHLNAALVRKDKNYNWQDLK